MGRQEKRAEAKAAKAAKWRNLARQFRGMASNQLLTASDRVALRDAAKRLDAGESPLRTLARISGTLARIEAMSQEKEL